MAVAKLKPWSTKEEIITDITRASGRISSKREEIIKDSCLVIGNAPPPVLEEEHDDQMHLLFGDAGRKPFQPSNATPDLKGIQQMLRMVQEGSGDGEDYTNNAANGSEYVVISKFSNLNPNVQEFVPKGVTAQTQAIEVKALPAQKQAIEVKGFTAKTQAIEVNTEETGINKSEVDVLKKKISDAAKSNSFELKKEKNVAIATLLRLHASNNNIPTTTNTTNNLKTPDFFVSKPEAKSAPSEQINTIPSTSSSVNSSPCAISKLDPEIRNSIEKVNKWLEEPNKRKSPAVYLGPIEFKKKNVPPVQTPDSSISPNLSQGKIRQYQPSKYATDLAQKYKEKQNKNTHLKKDVVTWSNLDEKLREKDILIKASKAEKSGENNDSSSTSR